MRRVSWEEINGIDGGGGESTVGMIIMIITFCFVAFSIYAIFKED
jgi:hypothetical protein